MSLCKIHGTQLVDGECLRCANVAPVSYKCQACEKPAQVLGWDRHWCSVHYFEEQRKRGFMDWRDREVDRRIHGD